MPQRRRHLIAPGGQTGGARRADLPVPPAVGHEQLPHDILGVAFSATLATAVCGASGSHDGSNEPTTGPQVFASAGRSGCHTVDAAGANGTVGPNLEQLAPSAATVRRQVIHGGGAMPSFKNTVSPQRINAVAAYVARVAGRE